MKYIHQVLLLILLLALDVHSACAQKLYFISMYNPATPNKKGDLGDSCLDDCKLMQKMMHFVGGKGYDLQPYFFSFDKDKLFMTLAYIQSVSGPEDVVWVYTSSHGVNLRDDPRTHTYEYILQHEERYIRHQDIVRLMSRIDAHLKIIMSDACTVVYDCDIASGDYDDVIARITGNLQRLLSCNGFYALYSSNVFNNEFTLSEVYTNSFASVLAYGDKEYSDWDTFLGDVKAATMQRYLTIKEYATHQSDGSMSESECETLELLRQQANQTPFYKKIYELGAPPWGFAPRNVGLATMEVFNNSTATNLQTADGNYTSLKLNDIVVSINGYRMASDEDFVNVISSANENSNISLTVIRASSGSQEELYGRLNVHPQMKFGARLITRNEYEAKTR